MSSNLVKYCLITMPLTSFGLGVWQLKRLEWKKGLIADLDKKITQDPIDLLEIESLEDLKEFEYRPIKAKGNYDPDPNHQLYLKPRQLVVNKEALYRGRTAHQSNIGADVITPFHVAGTNLRILVNRGWLALKGKDNLADNAHIGLNDGQIDLVGVLRTSDTRPKYGMKNDETTNAWAFRDVTAMAKALRTAPIFIDAAMDESRRSGPFGGQTQLNVRNEHLNYAITWFTLSVLCMFLWYNKYGRRSKFIR